MAKNDKALTVTQGGALDTLQLLIQELPGAAEDPLAGMIEAVMNAETPEEIDSLFSELPSLQENDGRSFRVHAIRKARSSIEGSGEWYLIAAVTWLDSGEDGAVAVSATMPMAQLLKCHREGWLPRDFRIEVKKEATQAGFHPINLRSVPKRVSEAVEALGGQVVA